MREDKVQELMQRMSSKNVPAQTVDPLKEERIQRLMQSMKKNPEESMAGINRKTGYHQEGLLGNPEHRKALARGAVGLLPDLAQLIARIPRAALESVGLPQPEINDHPLSEDVFQLMKDAGLDIISPPPKDKSEAVQRAILEGVGSSVVPIPGGAGANLLSKALPAAAKAIPKALKSIPYVSKGVENLAKLAPQFLKGPETAKQAVGQGILGGTVLGTSEALQQEGISPLQARLASVALPIVAGAGYGVARNSKAGQFLADELTPGGGRRQAANRLGEVDVSDVNIANKLGEMQTPESMIKSHEPVGAAIRKDALDYIERHEKEIAPISQQYEEAKKMTDLIQPRNAIQEAKDLLRPLMKKQSFGGSKENREMLSKIIRDLSQKEINPDIIKVNPEGMAKVQKNTGLPLHQIDAYKSDLQNESSKAAREGNNTKSKFLNQIINKLDNDLETNPMFKAKRKAYREASLPINLIKDDAVFGPLLKKTDYNAEHTIKDSEIATKVINFSMKGEGKMKRLLEIIKHNPETQKLIKNYVNSQIINKITTKGKVELEKLDNFVKNNSGVFDIDPSLKTKLKNVENAQLHHNKLIKNLLADQAEEISLLKTLGGKALLGAGLGSMTQSLPGAGLVSGLSAGIGALQVAKKNAYQQAIKKGLQERNY